MKNVYARFSYATRRDGEVYDPYVQLMPITDIEDAHHDWETWCAKWGGSSSQPSPTVQPTPDPSSPSIHPSPASSFSSSSSLSTSTSFSSSVSSSSSSSAPNPLATGGNNRISGAVEDDDDTEEKTDTVCSFLFPSLISAYLTYLSGQSLLTCHHRWLGPRWPCSHLWYCLRREEDAKRS